MIMESGDSYEEDICEYVKTQQVFSINTRIIPVKAMYFFLGCVQGSLLPFLNLFFVSVGLSPTQAGLITGIRFVASITAGPLWGALSDYTRKSKVILTALCLGGLVIFSMPWVARSILNPANVMCDIPNNISYNDSFAINDKNPHNNLFAIDITHSFNKSLDKVEVNCTLAKEEAKKLLFRVLLALITFGTIFVGSLNGFVISIVMQLIETGKEKASYGGQFMFSVIGFSLASYASGLTADYYKCCNMSHYTAVFFIYLPMILILIPIGCYTIRLIDCDGNEDMNVLKRIAKSNNKRTSIRSHLSLLFRKSDNVFFMTTVFISGLGNSMFFYFTLLFVNDESNTSKANMSLAMVVGTMSQVVVFPFTSKLIKLLRGTENTIILGIFCYFIRYFGMSYSHSFLIIVFLQLFHAFSFGLTWAAIIEHVNVITPPEIKHTMFQIINSIHDGLSPLLANIIGGKLYHSYGGRLVFRGEGIICLVWTLIMIVYYSYKSISTDNAHGKYMPVNSEKEEDICRNNANDENLKGDI